MGFSRQEYWSGLPFPSPGDLPDPGIEPRSPTLQAEALTSEPPGKQEVYRNTILPQEIRKTSNRHPNFTPKTTGKRRKKKKTKINRRKEIRKI